MPHDEHPTLCNSFDLGTDPPATFELNCIDSGFFEKPAGVTYRLVAVDLIGKERHVTNNKGIGSTAAHGLGVPNTLIHGYRNCTFVPVDAHAERVTYQNHIHARLLCKLGCPVVIRCHPNHLLTGILHLLEIKSCHFLFHCHTLNKYILSQKFPRIYMSDFSMILLKPRGILLAI